MHIPYSSIFGTTSSPVFLSSLDCSSTDRSLLYDCGHTQLGLATCDQDFGYAVAKCVGELKKNNSKHDGEANIDV